MVAPLLLIFIHLHFNEISRKEIGFSKVVCNFRNIFTPFCALFVKLLLSILFFWRTVALRTVSNYIQLPAYVPTYILMSIYYQLEIVNMKICYLFLKSTNGGMKLCTVLPKKMN